MNNAQPSMFNKVPIVGVREEPNKKTIKTMMITDSKGGSTSSMHN